MASNGKWISHPEPGRLTGSNFKINLDHGAVPQHRVGFSVGDPQAPIQLSAFDLIVEYKSEIYASMKNYQDKDAYMNALNLRM